MTTVSKALVCFTVCVLFVAVGEISAFLPDKSISLEQSDVVRYAKTVNDFAKEYPEIAKRVPSLLKVAGKVAEQGIGVIKANPALGVGIYFGAILLTAYYLTKDAEIQLMKANFQYQELDMIIEKAMGVVEMFDTAIKEDGVFSKKMKYFCTESRDDIFNFDKAIETLQRERKKIEQRMIESTTGETRSKFLQYLSGGVGLTSTIGTAAACLATGPACPLIIGSGMAISSAVGSYLFGNSQSTYRQSFEVLVRAREDVLNAEKMLRQAKVDSDKACLDVMSQASDYLSLICTIIIVLILAILKR